MEYRGRLDMRCIAISVVVHANIRLEMNHTVYFVINFSDNHIRKYAFRVRVELFARITDVWCCYVLKVSPTAIECSHR